MVQTRKAKSMGNAIPVRLPPRNNQRSTFSNGRRINSGQKLTQRNSSPLPPLPKSHSKLFTISTSTGASRLTTNCPEGKASSEDSVTNMDLNANSESTKSMERRHFLKGFNFDNCHDLLSIPDPPTPEIARSRNRRRQSTSSFWKSATIPLQDVTNDKERSPLLDKNISTRKKRKSLCHVPSPAFHETPTKKHSPGKSCVTGEGAAIEISQLQHLSSPQEDIKTGPYHAPEREKDQDHLLENESKAQADIVADHSSPRQKNLEIGNDEEGNGVNNTSSSYQKQSSRRRSILLPSEIDLKDWPASVTEQQTTSGTGQKSPLDKERQNDFHCETDFPEIRRHIRAYCSLPQDSILLNEHADMIRRKTGYSLPGPTSVSGPASPHSCQVELQRKDLLAKIEPVMQLMEEQKVTQKQIAQQITSCTVEKIRGGKYRYRDPWGNKVRPEEYKQRYLEMVNKQKRQKSEALRAVLRQLEACSEEGPSGGEAQRICLSCPRQEEEKRPSSGQDLDPAVCRRQTGDENDMDITNCSCDLSDVDNLTHFRTTAPSPEVRRAPIKREERVQGEIIDPLGGENGVHSLSFISEKGESKEGISFAEVVSSESSSPDSSSIAKRRRFPTTSEISSNVTVAKNWDSTHNVDDFVVPVPSRNGETSDPEIATAENKLWQSIDQALEIYSREVAEIQARRRAEHTAANSVTNS